MIFEDEDSVQPQAPRLRSLSANVIIKNAQQLIAKNGDLSIELRQEDVESILNEVKNQKFLYGDDFFVHFADGARLPTSFLPIYASLISDQTFASVLIGQATSLRELNLYKNKSLGSKLLLDYLLKFKDTLPKLETLIASNQYFFNVYKDCTDADNELSIFVPSKRSSNCSTQPSEVIHFTQFFPHIKCFKHSLVEDYCSAYEKRRNIMQLENLEFLDISQASTSTGDFDSPALKLYNLVSALPKLKKLDIANTNLCLPFDDDTRPENWPDRVETDVQGLRGLHKNLEFLSIFHCENITSSLTLPAYSISSELDEESLLLALETYMDRPEILQTALNELFQIYRLNTDEANQSRNNQKGLHLILKSLLLHQLDRTLQISGTAALFYAIRNNLMDSIVKRRVVEVMLAALETFNDEPVIVRNCCLSLCQLNIPQDVVFVYSRMISLLVQILNCHSTDNTTPRVVIYLLNSLACQTGSDCKSIAGIHGAIESVMAHIERKLQKKICDEIVDVSFSFLWNITDETEVNCKLFLQKDGLNLFLRCYNEFRTRKDLDELIKIFLDLLEVLDEGIETSYNAAGVLSQLLSDKNFSSANISRDLITERVIGTTKKWQLDAKRFINYRSFAPILKLLPMYHAEASPKHFQALFAIANLTTTDREKYCDFVCSRMSRSGLQAADRETFIKTQIIACQKVLNKAEAPLKQKHVRALIVGTHKEKSASLFWNTVARIQLEKIRDGHRRVPDDCSRHVSRLVQLGNFWQHLRASGYGAADAMYCRLLTKRLQFHQKFTIIPGNLTMNDHQIGSLTSDLNNAFELAIDLLDQLDELIAFKTAVLSLVDSFRWTSMIPQAQCLLAPLILVILDTSVLYDLSVKVIFKLHETLPADVLSGHRERFYALFKKIKEFYQTASNLQYFRYLVSVPTLPDSPPNFLQASDLNSYQTQHAFLRNENDGSEGTETPPDAQSLQEDSILIDLSMPEVAAPVGTSSSVENDRLNSLEQQVNELRNALNSEMKSKEDILNEARSRIEQQLKEASNANEQQAEIQRQAEEKAAELERKYQKLKSAYETFRGEHLTMLYELRDLRKFKEERGTEIDELKKQLSDEQAKSLHAQQLLLKSQLITICESAQQMLTQCNEDLNNSSTISYPTHLAESALRIAQTWLQNLSESAAAGNINAELNKAAILFCHHLTESLVPCAAAAYNASIEHYEPVLHQCKRLTTESAELYDLLKKEAWSELNTGKLSQLIDSLKGLEHKMGALPTATGDIDAETIGNQLQEEMDRMNNAIKHAVERIKEIQTQAQQKNSGARLAVNEKILEQCKGLMAAVYLLVERSRDLQKEIVEAGRGTAPPNEFYKRNHQWTKGLLSAAQAVGVSALELMNSADKVILNEGKFEYLIVAAQEISASVAQLFVSSRVKADRGSERLSLLGQASKQVNEATASVIASVKSGKQTLEEEELFDFSQFSLHDTKKTEMESQVKVLGLEADLAKERTRLASLRKQHYHLAALVAKEQQEGN
ncbi:hypothetical protein M3Y97_00810300 [Aphelenchoides bicaudatus]|nr:hypothetical protein M3Y97_00810300 [Aphelenchoides bicaudatus]